MGLLFYARVAAEMPEHESAEAEPAKVTPTEVEPARATTKHKKVKIGLSKDFGLHYTREVCKMCIYAFVRHESMGEASARPETSDRYMMTRMKGDEREEAHVDAVVRSQGDGQNHKGEQGRL